MLNLSFLDFNILDFNKVVRFFLANVVTEDKSNEFSFRIKRELVNSGENNAIPEYHFELEAKAKVPTTQVWGLKLDPGAPISQESVGQFRSDIPGTRINKQIADKPYVDYALHIDKCSPIQIAKMATAAAVNAASGGSPPPAKRGRM